MIVTIIYSISAMMLLVCLIAAAYCLTRVSPIKDVGSGSQLLAMCATIFFLIGVCLFGAIIFFVATHTNQVNNLFAEMFEYMGNNPLVLGSITILFPIIFLVFVAWQTTKE
ncbi:hypothetical protein [Leuconostoc citreum]